MKEMKNYGYIEQLDFAKTPKIALNAINIPLNKHNVNQFQLS